MSTCDITPGCEFGLHGREEHPCGKPLNAGDPCTYCGDPIAAGPDGFLIPCPRCWRTATIADIKALAADAGLQTRLTLAPTEGDQKP